MELTAGELVGGRYEISSVLGEGGMAVVYRCRHVQLGTEHALKVLTITHRAIRERLVQEGQLQAKLRHANIVAVTDIVDVAGAPGLIMEFIDGPSLDELLERGMLSVEQMDALADGLFDGVAYAHDQGLVHRDLKPGNIMLEPNGQQLLVKVMDFGLAKLLNGDQLTTKTKTGSTMGTPHYMSPEQVADTKNVDHRTDVFALGAILFEMATGQRAFGGESLYEIFGAVAEGRFRNPSELQPNLPKRMVDAILGALHPDKDARIQTVEGLRGVWSGAAAHVGREPVAPAGPFSAAFVDSLKSVSQPNIPKGTWTPVPVSSKPPVMPTAMDAWAADVAASPADSVAPAAPVAHTTALAPEPAESRPSSAVSPPVSTVSVPDEPPAAAAAVASGGQEPAKGGRGTALLVGGGLVSLLIGGTLSAVAIGVVVFVLWQPDDSGVDSVDVADTIAVVNTPQRDSLDGRPSTTPKPVTAGGNTAPVSKPTPLPPPSPTRVAQPPVPDRGDAAQPIAKPEPLPGAVVMPAPLPVAEPTNLDAVPIPEPALPPPAAAGDLAGLDHARPGKRIEALERSRSSARLSTYIVRMARTDSNRDVAVKAWQTLVYQYKNRIGDRGAQEAFIAECVRTNQFSRTEAAGAYGARGSDPRVLEPSFVNDVGTRPLFVAITAMVQVGQRGDRALARSIVEERLSRARGLTKARLEAALQRLQ